MLKIAHQCSKIFSNAQQLTSNRLVLLKMLNTFFKKLMSSPPSPPPPNQRIRGTPRSLDGAPKNCWDLEPSLKIDGFSKIL